MTSYTLLLFQQSTRTSFQVSDRAFRQVWSCYHQRPYLCHLDAPVSLLSGSLKCALTTTSHCVSSSIMHACVLTSLMSVFCPGGIYAGVR